MRSILKEVYPFMLALILIAAAVFGYYSVLPQVANGSVITGQAYNSTTSISTSAGSFWQARSTSNVGGCELGSVIIASSTAASTFRLWDATSTTDVASTSIVVFPTSAVAGTYTFDIVCKRGLIIDTPTGFNGVYVVTWR